MSLTRHMNTKHENLKFRFDFEESNSFSLMLRCKGLSTSVFCEATFVRVLRNFDSFNLSLIKQILFLHYCFAISQFAQICR